ncbi:unnamed protein product [Clonostachys rosea]|uniref:FAD dependent oxidoreductase domain-containing protein n=1 Tax=Bionectria ochroleuca TaxID=29856 RepID=A0ABY6UTM6_BIOOC|nr:unnamed protein product [Clonostachys rosea]
MFKQLAQDPRPPVDNPSLSYWQSPPHKGLLGVQSTTLPSIRDVIVIGSGITSCSVTRELFEAGFSGTISVLEAREVCSGATGRNGGRINCVAIQDYHKYVSLFGVEVAKSIVRFEMAHYDEIVKAAQSLGDEAFKRTEIRPVETVAVVFSEEKLQDLKSMLENFEAVFSDLRGRWKVIEAEEVRESYGVKDATGALIGTAGAGWAYRLITEVFDRLLKDHPASFSIETKTMVTGISRIESNQYPYSIKTTRGVIRAKHVLHCTEGHVSHLVPQLRGILVPRRGQMSVLNPGNKFRDSRGNRSWSFYYDQGFDYVSQNEHTKELFAGGGDTFEFNQALSTFGVSSDAEENIRSKIHLAGFMPVAFGEKHWGEQDPGKPILKASWVGVMCNSLDHVPFVGLLPQEALGPRPAGDWESGGEWISAGYGGYGMVNAWLCGKALARQIVGGQVPSWLPVVYQATPARVTQLQNRLAKLKDTENHLRALL